MKTKKILIADSGATKTDWTLATRDGLLQTVKTQGLSPLHQSADDIRTTLTGLRAELNEKPDAVYFYGAGCTPVVIPSMQRMIEGTFEEAKVEVASDLLGAARALCGHRNGIACILGTGTNSGLYDGRKIVRNVPPLGYILGDEGSGAVMGRNFVADVLKGLLPRDITEAFYHETGATKDDVIRRVYREPLAARYLAAFSPFLQRHRSHPAVSQFLQRHFRAFFVRNIRAYGRPELDIHFVGGIAFTFRPEIEQAAVAEGFHVGRTERSPMAGLLAYHGVGGTENAGQGNTELFNP